MTRKQVIEQTKELLGCDSARITKTLGKFFLIIEYNRNTKDDMGQWHKNGKPIDFDYMDGTIIASGWTLGKIWEEVKQYKEGR